MFQLRQLSVWQQQWIESMFLNVFFFFCEINLNKTEATKKLGESTPKNTYAYTDQSGIQLLHFHCKCCPEKLKRNSFSFSAVSVLFKFISRIKQKHPFNSLLLQNEKLS